MHDRTNNPDNPVRPKSPSANLALMIIHDWPAVAALESELMKQGFQVLRAQHAMHGYWLAMNLQPNLIVSDLREIESTGENLLKYLKGSKKTLAIPIVYLSDHASAELETRLRSRGIARCLPTGIAPQRFARELTRLLHASKQDDATKIDAVFSELGSQLPQTDRNASPGWLPTRVDSESPAAITSPPAPHEPKEHPVRRHQMWHVQHE